MHLVKKSGAVRIILALLLIITQNTSVLAMHHMRGLARAMSQRNNPLLPSKRALPLLGIAAGVASAQNSSPDEIESPKELKLAHQYDPAQTIALLQLLVKIGGGEAIPIEDTPRILSLICAGADPHQEIMLKTRGRDGYYEISTTLLRQYLEANNCKAVACLLDHGANPNFIYPGKPERDEIPLKYAHSPEMVRILLEKGADIHRSLYKGNILHYAAAYNRSPYVLAELCRAGLDPNSANRDDSTPFHELFYVLPDERDLVKSAGVLYWYGGSLSHKNRYGQSPLDRIADRPRLTQRVSTFIERLSRRRAECADASSLTASDIDAWDELIEKRVSEREKLYQFIQVYAPNALRELREEIKKERAMQNSARAESGEQPAAVSTPVADDQHKAERDEATRIIGNIMSPVQTKERVSDPLVGDYTVFRGGGCLNWVMFD